MRFVLMSILAVFSITAWKVQALTPEEGFGDSALDNLFADFEDICLPFILHHSEVPHEMDRGHFKSLLEGKGYRSTRNDVAGEVLESRKIERYRFDAYLKPKSKTANQNYSTRPSAKLYWRYDIANNSIFNLGQRCQMQITKNGIDTSGILALLKTNDSRWTEIPPRRSYHMPISIGKGRVNLSKDTKGQFTVFKGANDEVVTSIATMLGPVHYYTLCAAGEDGLIEVLLKIGATEHWLSMPNETKFITLIASQRECDIPTK